MRGSAVEQLLEAMHAHEVEGMLAVMTAEPRLLLADGRRAAGRDEVRELLTDCLGMLRASSHRILAQWHLDGVSIAEVEGDYELRDWLQLNGLPRVFVARTQDERIADLRVYGAHERPLSEHRTGEEGMWLGARWIPPL